MSTREQDVRTWSMLCHLSALAGFIFGLGNVIGPLIVWQLKKNELPEIDPHGREAVNFQLTILILDIIAGMLIAGIMGWGFGFGFGHFWHSPFYMLGGGIGLGVIVGLINLAGWVLAVVAGIKANNGEPFRYPFSFRFFK